MNEEQFQCTMRSFKGRSPFRPFVVELVTGDRVRVDQPEGLVMRGRIAVFLNARGAPSIFDHEGVSQVIADLA